MRASSPPDPLEQAVKAPVLSSQYPKQTAAAFATCARFDCAPIGSHLELQGHEILAVACFGFWLFFLTLRFLTPEQYMEHPSSDRVETAAVLTQN
jgi:hypothetical protein